MAGQSGGFLANDGVFRKIEDDGHQVCGEPDTIEKTNVFNGNLTNGDQSPRQIGVCFQLAKEVLDKKRAGIALFASRSERDCCNQATIVGFFIMSRAPVRIESVRI